jgi:hypothetical protein
MSAYGSIAGGQAQNAMAQYQAGLARMNAQIAKQNAIYATQRGEAEAMQSGMKTREQIGETITRQAATGLDVNQGTGVQVRRSEQELGTYDQTVLRSNAAVRAYGMRSQGLMDIEQGRLDEYGGRYSVIAGNINAGSSIMGTIGSVAGKWIQGQQVGLAGGSAWGGYNPGQNTDWPTA